MHDFETGADPLFTVRQSVRYDDSSKDTRTFVELTGELDLSVAPALHAALKTVVAPLTIDMSGVRYVDSSSLTAFVRLANRIAPQRAAIIGLQPQVRRIFEIVSFDRLFQIDGAQSAAGSANDSAGLWAH